LDAPSGMVTYAEITRLIDIAAPTFTLWGIQS
jgi:hypothetical protein